MTHVVISCSRVSQLMRCQLKVPISVSSISTSANCSLIELAQTKVSLRGILILNGAKWDDRWGRERQKKHEWRERSIFLLYTVYAVSTGFYMSWYSKCVCKCVCVESNLCKQQLWRSCSEGTFLFEICCQLRTHTDTHAHTGVSCFWLSRSTKAANVEFIPFLFECQWLKSFSVMNRSVLLFYKKRVCVCVCARLLYMQWNTKTLNFFFPETNSFSPSSLLSLPPASWDPEKGNCSWLPCRFSIVSGQHVRSSGLALACDHTCHLRRRLSSTALPRVTAALPNAWITQPKSPPAVIPNEESHCFMLFGPPVSVKKSQKSHLSKARPLALLRWHSPQIAPSRARCVHYAARAHKHATRCSFLATSCRSIIDPKCVSAQLRAGDELDNRAINTKAPCDECQLC